MYLQSIRWYINKLTIKAEIIIKLKMIEFSPCVSKDKKVSTTAIVISIMNAPK